MDLLVSTKPFCSLKSDLTYLSMCLVCSHPAKFGHVSPILGAVCGGTYCEVTNQVCQISHIFYQNIRTILSAVAKNLTEQ